MIKVLQIEYLDLLQAISANSLTEKFASVTIFQCTFPIIFGVRPVLGQSKHFHRP